MTGARMTGLADAAVLPAVMSGGAGTRLWPVSRRARAKQFHALVGAETMLAETLARVSPAADARFAPPLLIGSARDANALAAAARGVPGARIVLEPVGRNTAPVAAAAALVAAETRPDALVLLAPADHHIADPAAFRAAVFEAVPAAADGALVTFGVSPDRPATGYGYIKKGAPHASGRAALVEAFVEKPDAATAARYLESGDYLWNAGVFLFRADVMLEELARWRPDITEASRAAYAGATRDGAALLLNEAAFEACPSDSVDYAVMEKTERAAVAPAAFPWTDLGAWDAVWDVSPKDAGGLAACGDVLAIDVKNALLRSDGPLLAAIGVEDLVVVATGDAVFVAPKSRAQDVKALVQKLKDQGRPEAERFVEPPAGDC